MPKLAVYDAKNRARLLGFYRTNRRYPGACFRVAVMQEPSLTARMSMDRYLDETVMRTVTFNYEKVSRRDEVARTEWYEETVEKRWTVLTTEAELSILMAMDEFVLPDAQTKDTREAEAHGRELQANSFGGNKSFY